LCPGFSLLRGVFVTAAFRWSPPSLQGGRQLSCVRACRERHCCRTPAHILCELRRAAALHVRDWPRGQHRKPLFRRHPRLHSLPDAEIDGEDFKAISSEFWWRELATAPPRTSAARATRASTTQTSGLGPSARLHAAPCLEPKSCIVPHLLRDHLEPFPFAFKLDLQPRRNRPTIASPHLIKTLTLHRSFFVPAKVTSPGSKRTRPVMPPRLRNPSRSATSSQPNGHAPLA
jgi:hypothetical protein